ncbi:hypothetical protein DCAR_0414608 [Daucus carota subsp. sativus]|uniref:Uncharacterized protein n=1 Tax=Daucus carota subsp. sativus TaxID=79200 RepID=A0A175YBW7_DAUCS|nr:hypothetical protein DCAR_0414608 [Daucus carota subsp. sativus]
MRIENNNIATIPTDIVIVLLELLLAGGFQDFYNFFMAWSQTQRAVVITSLLEKYPLRTLYKYGCRGSPADLLCFDNFFRIAENLGIGDAILYRRCRAIIYGAGDIDAHFTVLDTLSGNKHFLAMVANFILRSLYKQGTNGATLQVLIRVLNHPNYQDLIGPAVNHLSDIHSYIIFPELVDAVDIEACCPIHSTCVKVSLENQCPYTQNCLFCNIALMVTVFTRKPLAD